MPIIPLRNGGMSEQAQGLPVGPQLQQPSGMRVNLAGAAQNYAVPDLPKELADTSGQQAWGKSLDSIGQVAGQLSMQLADRQNEKDVLTARNKMQQTLGDFEVWKANNADPRIWQKTWDEEFLPKLKTSVLTDNLSPYAKSTISNHLSQFETESAVHIATSAASTLANQTKGLAIQAGDDALDKGDLPTFVAMTKAMVPKGLLSPEAASFRISDGTEKHRQRQLEAATTQVMDAAKLGDPEAVKPLLDQYQKLGAQDYQIEHLRQMAATEVDHAQQAQAAKTDNDTMGKIVLDLSRGAQYTPETIDKLAEEGLLTNSTAAHLRQHVQSMVGAAPNQFEGLMTKVMGYNAQQDAANGFRDSQALNREMLTMRLSPDQLTRYEEGLKTYGAMNANPNGSLEASTDKVIHESILDVAKAHEKPVVDRTGDFMQAVKNPEYLKALGLPADVQTKLAGTVTHWFSSDTTDSTKRVDGPAAMDLFKKGMAKATIDPTKYNALPPDVKQLFEDAQHGKLIEKKEDPGAKQQAAFDAAKLIQDYQGWKAQYKNQHNGNTPSVEEAQKWLRPRTDGVMKGAALDQIFNSHKPDVSQSPVNGSVTSFGYKNDRYRDSKTAAGLGAFTNDNPDTRLKAGDLAVSPDVEVQLRDAGIKPLDSLKVKLADGSEHAVRWADRTMQDDQATEEFGRPLRGRFDFFSPGGKHPKDGLKVIGFSKL